MSDLRINTQQPLNWNHPLNKGRLAWWHFLPYSGQWGSHVYGRDLTKSHNLAFTSGGQTPQYTSTPRGQAMYYDGTGGGLGWYARGSGSGTRLGVTDNFTIGCTIKTATVSPIDIGGRAGLVCKYHTAGENAFFVRQHGDKVEFGGNAFIETTSFLDTTNIFRIIAVQQNGAGAVYVNGSPTPLVTGSPTFSVGTSDVLIGVNYLDTPSYFIGWINDVFVSNRPWGTGDIALDYKLSRRGYLEKFSPLNFLPPTRWPATDSSTLVSFTTEIGVGPAMQFANTAEFETDLFASADCGGIGDTEPSSIADFETVVNVNPNFGAGEPTLVGYETTVGVASSAQVGAPAEFTTTVAVQQSMSSTVNGDSRILNQRRYRR